MARFWKERSKGTPFDWNALPLGYWPEHLRSVVPLTSARLTPQDRLLPVKWMYCVEVCKFTFRFHSIAEMTRCRSYFGAPHLPSQRRSNPRRAKNTGDLRRTVQTRLARLPMRLKTAARRAKIARALEEALRYFARECRAEPGVTPDRGT